MAQGNIQCYSAPRIPATFFTPILEQNKGTLWVMDTQACSTHCSDTSLCPFMDPCGHSSHPFSSYIFIFPKTAGPGGPSSSLLSIFTTPTCCFPLSALLV